MTNYEMIRTLDKKNMIELLMHFMCNDVAMDLCPNHCPHYDKDTNSCCIDKCGSCPVSDKILISWWLNQKATETIPE